MQSSSTTLEEAMYNIHEHSNSVMEQKLRELTEVLERIGKQIYLE